MAKNNRKAVSKAPPKNVDDKIETRSDIYAFNNTKKPQKNLPNSNFEVNSNIDGYSQSDMWEGDSQGYLQNSKKLLYRFKLKGGGFLKSNASEEEYFGNRPSTFIKNTKLRNKLSDNRKGTIQPGADYVEFDLANSMHPCLPQKPAEPVKNLPRKTSPVNDVMLNNTETRTNTKINSTSRKSQDEVIIEETIVEIGHEKKPSSNEDNLFKHVENRQSNLQSFNPIQENKPTPTKNEENVVNQVSEVKQPYHSPIKASKVPAAAAKVPGSKQAQKPKNDGQEISFMPSDLSPLTFDQGRTNFNYASPSNKSPQSKQKKKQSPKSKNQNSVQQQQQSPTVVVYANSPYQESNEGKLIRKLGEKTKMLEKYEVMLSKVNSEFQSTLNKNKELSDEITKLELKLKSSEENSNSDFKRKF